MKKVNLVVAVAVVLATSEFLFSAPPPKRSEPKPRSQQTSRTGGKVSAPLKSGSSTYNRYGQKTSSFRENPTGINQYDRNGYFDRRYSKTPTGYNVWDKYNRFEGTVRTPNEK